MALLGVIAPLSYILGLKHLNIAASATHEISYTWGSSPKIDENMKWADTSIKHEGYHLNRVEKIENVVDFARCHNSPIKLRVCYSDKRDGYNCNTCAKCQRTILSLLLSGVNPSIYGFTAPPYLYKLILKNFGDEAVMTEGIKYQWKCLQEKAKKTTKFYIIKDEEAESEYIKRFANIDLDSIVNKNIRSVKRKKELKFILRNKFPYLYSFYQKVK